MTKKDNRSKPLDVTFKQAGLKKTLPRELIFDVLENNSQRHFSAEELYQVLLERGNAVSIATVYRVQTLVCINQNSFT